MKIKGLIFDMDGVVTQTAIIHYQAWKITFDELLIRVNPENKAFFTQQDYYFYLDGIPRKDGVVNFLNSRNISLEKIEKLYNADVDCITHICDLKNNLFLDIISRQKVLCYNDTLAFINYAQNYNYAIAIISSSKNCKYVLKNAGFENLFPVCVDGLDCEERGLPGKPSPDIFLEAAKGMGLLPEECVVIEDALFGVQAAKEGKFGGVIALDRDNKLYREFKSLDADFIVPDLSSNQMKLYQHLLFNSFSCPCPAFKVIPLLSNLTLTHSCIIFLDYDGTLTPIAQTPEQAILSSEMHECLAQLSKKYLIVIISGRELNNLKNHINLPNLVYLGNHGFQCEAPRKYNLDYQKGVEFKHEIHQILGQLNNILKDIPGCLIEDKIISLSVHYRQVDLQWTDFISDEIDRILLDFPRLKKHYGKKVYEIRPKIEWNKGIASANLLNNLKLKNEQLLPIYIGDDETDEDAFNELKSTGITIKVTSEGRPTQANYYLQSPQEVQVFLDNLNLFQEKKHE